MFYQTIFQYILNDNDKMYMCVVLVYFLTLCMSILGNFLLDTIFYLVNNTSGDKGGACANEKGAIGYHQK